MISLKSMIVPVLLITFVSVCTGYMYQTMTQAHPDYPGKCYWTSTKTAVSVGETYRLPNDCVEAVCNGDFSFSVMSCGFQMFDDPSCHEVEPDLNLPYPQCCQSWECVDEHGNTARF